MNSKHRSAIFALAAAGTLWGLNVPLTKLALGWLGPGWLTVARFLVAAPMLGLVGRRGLRDALTPRVLASGAVGFGVVIVLQNVGIEHTSVSHAAMIVGAIPVLVALMAAGLVDHVQVTLFPVITGQTGLEPIFQGAADFDLELVESRTLDGRTQELTYRPTLH